MLSIRRIVIILKIIVIGTFVAEIESILMIIAMKSLIMMERQIFIIMVLHLVIRTTS